MFGIIDNGPESLRPMWPAIVKVEFLNPTGVKWSIFAENIDPGPNAYQKKENRGGFERTNDVEFSTDGKTMYVARLRRTLCELPDGIAVLHHAEIRGRLDDHEAVSQVSSFHPGGCGRRFFCTAGFPAVDASFQGHRTGKRHSVTTESYR